jgi:hypothetical protein
LGKFHRGDIKQRHYSSVDGSGGSGEAATGVLDLFDGEGGGMGAAGGVETMFAGIVVAGLATSLALDDSRFR